MEIHGLKLPIARLTALGLLLLAAPGTRAAPVAANGPWPKSPPPLGVFQTRPAFSLATTRHLEALAVQHEHLSGERLILVVAAGSDPHPRADGLTELLSSNWRLDTTRRGASALLVLVKRGAGEIEVGYRPGLGLAKNQAASPEDLRRLRRTLEKGARAGSWDEIGEDSMVWLLQTVSSPLLERPELLGFPKATPGSIGHGTREPSPHRFEGQTPSYLTLVGLAVLVLAALGLVAEAIRRAIRLEVLIGPRRALRFGVLDRFGDLLRRRLRRIRQDEKGHGERKNGLLIESMEGSP